MTDAERSPPPPAHFRWSLEDGVGVATLDRPEKKNPLTFESYREMSDFFRDLGRYPAVKTVVVTGAGGNFCSGGDVKEIIGPLTERSMSGLLDFTRMTGDLVKGIRACPQPVVAAIDGICAGAGACIAMAADIRLGTPAAKVAFLFTRVGLAGADMGACAILPRLIGLGRASELLFTGRSMAAEEAERWGFLNRVVAADRLLDEALALARNLATGPTFAHGITKTMLMHEMTMTFEQAIEAEAQAQAICMQTEDFARAYRAFMDKKAPEFRGD